MGKKQDKAANVEVKHEEVTEEATSESTDEVELTASEVATAEFLERVQKPVGEETARERYDRVKTDTTAFLSSLKSAAKDSDSQAKNKVVSEVIQPAFAEIVKAAEEFTGLTVRRLSLGYKHLKGEEASYKVSHTINKARNEKDEDSDESTIPNPLGL